MTPDHAAALAKLDAGATIPHALANALYRAGVELARAETASVHVGYDTQGQNYVYAEAVRTDSDAWRVFQAALAAVADALTQGEGK